MTTDYNDKNNDDDVIDSDEPRNVVPINISEEMKKSFLDYSMSVIVSRALPDARDGLKPVHRRILYTMHILRNTPGAPYKKSARIVGDTMGRFHPHGDQAIYDALVRLSQEFSMRYTLVDGQGNFGSIDGDPAAAMRYTEVRMDKICVELLQDIEKKTVDFVPNYDDKELEPAVLPTRVPNLLINGASGIAVGMATNIPPHNIREVIDGLIHLIRNRDAQAIEIMRFIQGPDFPTGGAIYGRKGILDAYTTGRGRVIVRGIIDVEQTKNDRQVLVVSEIPYQVNKALLIEKIADLVKNKIMEEISDIRDESDKQGMRVVIFLKKDAVPEIVINKLYKLTALQSTFGVNMIAIVDGRPKLLTLKELLIIFYEHRRQVIIRRSEHELSEALHRSELVKGLGVASLDITEVIEMIKSSRDPDEARARLTQHDFTGLGSFLLRAGISEEEAEKAEKHYRLKDFQAQAILDMRLQRLTGLQQDKLADEYRNLHEKIRWLEDLLGSDERLREEIIKELTELREKYGDDRRTTIIEESGELSVEDLIEDEQMVITMTSSGYIKRTPAALYKAQNRGGKGKRGAQTVDEEDTVTHVLTASSLSTLLFFTNTGRVFKSKVYSLPKSSPQSKGKALINFLGLQENEVIVAFVPIRSFEDEGYLFFATKYGTVKKTEISQFANINQNGIIAIKIDEGDQLLNVRVTDGTKHILMGTRSGLAARYNENDVRSMGRVSRGVRGIGLRNDDYLVELSVVDPNDEEATVLSVSERGFGKRSPLSEYSPHRRGSKGLISIVTNERNGKMASLMVVSDKDHLIVLTEKGQIIRLAVKDISVQSRNTQGVTLMRFDDDRIRDIAVIADGEDRADDGLDDEEDLEQSPDVSVIETETIDSTNATAPVISESEPSSENSPVTEEPSSDEPNEPEVE
ncbi:DNA gyrase subunit A [Myxococcota bacterium]|nr:DNA gyrase subunit A [Myxococcota bacterium]MBU1383082.1 DNA gyrase subunit A [Myxococcota bacterium]MBU1498255.1 DNA gyrase subunit A [Myxococcota bacterium]